MKKIGILVTHPVQYLSVLFRELAKSSDLTVYYCLNPDQRQQGNDFGVNFNWDVPLLQGYRYKFLNNISRNPDMHTYWGCDTPEIAEEIRDSRFDMFIIFGWYYKSAHQALAACRKQEVPVYARGDSTIMSNKFIVRIFKKVFFRIFLNKFDGFLAPGRKFREYLRFYGVGEDKIIFCPHFVDNHFFKNMAFQSRQNRDLLRREFGIEPDDFVFLFCGKLIKRKSPLDMLKALAVLKSKGIDAKAIIAGDGVLRNMLQRYAQEKELNVSFLGFRNQSQLPQIYALSDCLVLPSTWSETWGLVVNEAFACAVPAIVSSRAGCVRDMIEEGATGYSYKYADIRALSGCMARLISDYKNKVNFSAEIERKLKTYCVEEAVSSIMKVVA